MLHLVMEEKWSGQNCHEWHQQAMMLEIEPKRLNILAIIHGFRTT
jgi:hypothetical protein